jgi:hypothetical protein
MVRDTRREAAGYRTQLRDAEAQRDQLQETVSGWQSAELAELATAAGIAKTALADVATHVPLESVVDEKGLLDAAKIDAALSSLKTERPHLFEQVGANVGTGVASFSQPREEPREASWADVI